MKKLFSKIVLLVLTAAICFSAAACGTKNWKESDVTLKNWGALIGNYGFIAETENYVYYINGIADNSEDNEFGMPVKGSLVAAKRSDIESGAETIERCEVVPKLFVAQDYNMGVFIYGDYVYYMTPTTDKNSSGNISYNEMEFTKTKLDGTETTTLIKIGAPSDQYRIVEKGGTVYLVINDTANSRIAVYNASTGALTEIAKTDARTNVKTSADGEADEYESLSSFKFMERDDLSSGVVAFVNTVYLDQYDADAAARDSQYSRTTAQYNKLYVYKIGDQKPTLAFSGKAGAITYAVSATQNGKVYYTATAANSLSSASQAYVATINELFNGTVGTRIFNADYVSDSNVLISADEAYMVESGIVKKVSLIENDAEPVANVLGSVTMIDVIDGYLYYLNESSEYCRIKLEYSAKYERISDGSVTTAWYSPCVIEGFAYYSDATAKGNSNIRVVSIGDDNLVAVDGDGKIINDNSTEVDHYYFKDSVSIAVMTDADAANAVDVAISDITDSLSSGKLVFDTNDDGEIIIEDGSPVIKGIVEADNLYAALSDSAKEAVGSYALLAKYKEAYDVSKVLYKLNDFDKLTDAAKDALKDAYTQAKARIEAITANGFKHNEITDLCVNNLVWFYQTAADYFAE